MTPAYHPPDEGEVFNTFHDLVHAAILAAGTGAASLKEIYAACMRFGRVKCRKTGGWRLVTERRNWKSHIRHTLYTTEKFLRCPDDTDSWTLAPGYSHTLPQTTRHPTDSKRQVVEQANIVGARSTGTGRQPSGSNRSGRQSAFPPRATSRGPQSKRARGGTAAPAAAIATRRVSAEDDSWASEDEHDGAGFDGDDFAGDNDPDQLDPGHDGDPHPYGQAGDPDPYRQDADPDPYGEEDGVEGQDEGEEEQAGHEDGNGARGWQARGRPGLVAAGDTGRDAGVDAAARGYAGGGRCGGARALLGAPAAVAVAAAALPDVADLAGLLDPSDVNTRRAWMAAQEVANNPTAAQILLLLIHQRQHFLELPLQAHLAQWQLLEGLLPTSLLPPPQPFHDPAAVVMARSGGLLQGRAQRPSHQGPPHGRSCCPASVRQRQLGYAAAEGDDGWDRGSGDGEDDGTDDEQQEEGSGAGRPGPRGQRRWCAGRDGGGGAAEDTAETEAGVIHAQPSARRPRSRDLGSLEAAALLAAVASASGSQDRAQPSNPGWPAHRRPRSSAAAAAGGRRAWVGVKPAAAAQPAQEQQPAAAVWRSGSGGVMKVEQPHQREGPADRPQRPRQEEEMDWAGHGARRGATAARSWDAQPVQGPQSARSQRRRSAGADAGGGGGGGGTMAAPPHRTRSSPPLPPGMALGPAPAPPPRRPPSPPQPPARDAAPRTLSRAGSMSQGNAGGREGVVAAGAGEWHMPEGRGCAAGAGAGKSVFGSAAVDVEDSGPPGCSVLRAVPATSCPGRGSAEEPAETRKAAGAGGLERAGSLGKRPPTDSNSSSFGADSGDAGEEQQPQPVQPQHPRLPPQQLQEPSSKRMCQALDVARQLAAAAVAAAAAGASHGALRQPAFSALVAAAASGGERV